MSKESPTFQEKLLELQPVIFGRFFPEKDNSERRCFSINKKGNKVVRSIIVDDKLEYAEHVLALYLVNLRVDPLILSDMDRTPNNEELCIYSEGVDEGVKISLIMTPKMEKSLEEIHIT